jgi:hypothetical protein
VRQNPADDEQNNDNAQRNERPPPASVLAVAIRHKIP